MDVNTKMTLCQPRRGLGRAQESILSIAFLTSGTMKSSDSWCCASVWCSVMATIANSVLIRSLYLNLSKDGV